MARISICLPVYNGAAYVEEALTSIAAQTSKDYVVLASDNASTDQTSEILKRWSKQIPMEIVVQPQTMPMPVRSNGPVVAISCHKPPFHAQVSESQ